MPITNTTDLLGKRFGRLTVLAFSRMERLGVAIWTVHCDCGVEKEIRRGHLTHGNAKSCGCLQREVRGQSRISHGMSGSSLYNVWLSMKGRCTTPSYTRFENYGGRGIVFCDEWLTFEPFRDWALANGYQKGLQIDRADNNGNYCPENCRFVTSTVNANNTRKNVWLTAFGETKTRAQWSRDPRSVVPPEIFLGRTSGRGWSVERALLEPRRLRA